MKRVLSGIKPSGEVTLGNYLGAMRRWAQLSREGTDEYFFFVPNLHALTTRPEPEVLLNNSLSDVAWLVAMGLDFKKAVIFVQSEVPAHTELAWIFNNYVTMGELSRMTQFKDKTKSSGSSGQLVGLFTYPTLMAADILLYDVSEVPVGEDQIQHVELARDIANRFNKIYGNTFILPQATVQKSGARIMNLQNPNIKMSKSEQDMSGCILLGEPAAAIEKKIKRATTDSGKEIAYSKSKPAISNLLQIFSLVSGQSIESIEKQYQGVGYGEFKNDLSDLVLEKVLPIQKKHAELMASKQELIKILEQGRAKASTLAQKKLKEVKNKLGLI